MDGAGKIAVAIVVSALLMMVLWIAYHEYERRSDIAMVEQFFGGLSSVAQASADDAVRARARMDEAARLESGRAAQQRRAAAAEDLRRRALAHNQVCLGGVVVQVEGSSYTQLGTISRPVKCLGQYADQPLR